MKYYEKSYSQMTLLEYYAGLAMQALMSNSFNDGVTRPLAMHSRFEYAELAVSQAYTLICEIERVIKVELNENIK